MGTLGISDPVERLPPEIASKVLMYAAAKHIRSINLWMISTEYLLELTTVASSWMRLIIHTPALWSDIVLDRYESDILVKLAVHIALSRSALLSIVVLMLPRADEALLMLAFGQLRGHVDRIRELHVNQEPLLPTVEKFLGPLRHLVVLQFRPTYRIDPVDTATISFIERHTELKVIRGITVTPSIIDARWLLCLPTITSELPFRDLIPFLDKFRILRRVSFHHRLLEKLPLYQAKSPPSLPWTHIKLWDLYTIGNSFEPGQDMDLLISAVADSLTTLDVRIDTQLVPYLLLHLAQCRRLKCVDLSIVPIISTSCDSIFIPPSSTQQLTIHVDIGASWADGWGPAVLYMFKSSFPHVTRLTLMGTAAGELLGLTSSGTLPQLMNVSLHGLTHNPGPSFSLSPTLQTMKIALEPADIYQYKSTDLSCLDLHFSYEPERHLSGGLDLSHWPNLTDLRINVLHDKVQWSGSQFRSLRRIDIDHGSMYLTYYESGNLLYHLAKYPETFPVLQELKLQSFIDWDIFFIMLESRNSHSRAITVSPLESITFRSPISAGFAQLTSTLLAGEEIQRPSNLEFSWVGNMDIIRDAAIPGCIRCHKSLQYCDSKIELNPAGQESAPPLISSYPIDSKDVVATWQGRELEWRQYVEWQATLSQSRSQDCDHNKAYQTVRISPYGYYVDTQ